MVNQPVIDPYLNPFSSHENCPWIERRSRKLQAPMLPTRSKITTDEHLEAELSWVGPWLVTLGYNQGKYHTIAVDIARVR